MRNKRMTFYGGTLVFIAHSNAKNEKYVRFGCDATLHVARYPKSQSFTEMRRELSLRRCSPDGYGDELPPNTWQNNSMYVNLRTEMKEYNRVLHNKYRQGGVLLHHVLKEHFRSVQWVSFPSLLKVRVHRVRFIDHDGNLSILLAETDDSYLVVHWSGS